MTIETLVAGDPAACDRSARELACLGEATDRATTSVARRSTISTADFGGLSGDSFRRHAGSLAESLSAESGRCHRLARAMGQLAHDLDRVAGLMEQARQTARARRLVVEGTTIVVPGAHADPDQHRAWRELRAVVAGIRELEARAQREWVAALARDTGTAPPARPAQSPARGGLPGLPAPANPSVVTPGPLSSRTPSGAPGLTGVTSPAGPASTPGAETVRHGHLTPAATMAAEPVAETTWAAELVGPHAEPWSPAGTPAYEEMLDEPA
ncbi:hypothetical protein [Nocardioides sp.]|uniref:hypothetical protein n=1 Tax=Nocardioides sp. TaxID=35761 RepID=UPI0031FF3F62|nr:hypothetical protein [Nocardioides sp.]